MRRSREVVKNTIMKRTIFYIITVLFVIALLLTGCDNTSHKGDTSHVVITLTENSRYSEEDLKSATECIKNEFSGYTDCTLLELEYNNDTENGVVFFGEFETGKHSYSEGFESNTTYSGWSWELEKNNDGWKIVNYGMF